MTEIDKGKDLHSKDRVKCDEVGNHENGRSIGILSIAQGYVTQATTFFLYIMFFSIHNMTLFHYFSPNILMIL
jgi:hypothetical protein